MYSPFIHLIPRASTVWVCARSMLTHTIVIHAMPSSLTAGPLVPYAGSSCTALSTDTTDVAQLPRAATPTHIPPTRSASPLLELLLHSSTLPAPPPSHRAHSYLLVDRQRLRARGAQLVAARARRRRGRRGVAALLWWAVLEQLEPRAVPRDEHEEHRQADLSTRGGGVEHRMSDRQMDRR